MKKSVSSRDGKLGSHGNKISWPHRPDRQRWPLLTIRKVPADRVPYGSSISVNGKTVWAAYHDDELVAVADSRDAVWRKYRDTDLARRVAAKK
jgi:hypothetical protein